MGALNWETRTRFRGCTVVYLLLVKSLTLSTGAEGQVKLAAYEYLAPVADDFMTDRVPLISVLVLYIGCLESLFFTLHTWVFTLCC